MYTLPRMIRLEYIYLKMASLDLLQESRHNFLRPYKKLKLKQKY